MHLGQYISAINNWGNMTKELFIGKTNNTAKKPSKILVGNSSNIAKEVKSIFVGNSSNQAVKVFPSFPDMYQRCEYIYNTNGTEYIDSGVRPNSDTRVEIVFTRASTERLRLFGSFNSTGKQYMANIQNTTYPTSIYCGFGNEGNRTSNIEVNSKHTLLFNGSGGNFYLDGDFQFTSTKTFTALTYTMCIFGISNETGGVDLSSTGIYMYHFVVKQNNTVIRDMYPCYLKSDTQVVGMYDIANGVYYGNYGTGIFYKGPDVN